MTPKQSRASKEADAIKKLDDSALQAQERITLAADKAQKMIDDACTTATHALEVASRVPDKRNLNGSFQWDRGDRYRRGSDDRLQRLEDKFDELATSKGLLEIGAAQRIEQISGLHNECVSLREELRTKKLEIEHLATELDDIEKEITQRTTTLRELILEVKAGFSKEFTSIRKMIADEVDKIREERAAAERKFMWKVVGAVSAFGFLMMLVVITLVTRTFGGLP